MACNLKKKRDAFFCKHTLYNHSTFWKPVVHSHLGSLYASLYKWIPILSHVLFGFMNLFGLNIIWSEESSLTIPDGWPEHPSPWCKGTVRYLTFAIWDYFALVGPFQAQANSTKKKRALWPISHSRNVPVQHERSRKIFLLAPHMRANNQTKNTAYLVTTSTYKSTENSSM